MLNRLIYIILKAFCLYYSFYGLIVFFGPLDSMTLQNPDTPLVAKMIDESLSLLLFVLLVFHPNLYKLQIYLILFIIAVILLFVIFLRITEGYGANFSYVKSFIISIILLFAFTTIEISKILNLIRLFIHLNAVAIILSVAFFIKNPYLAYGGRLLGNYANPNASALVYTILLATLMLVGKRIYNSYRRKNLIVWTLIFIFVVGLITTFSKLYIVVSAINVLIMMNLGVIVVIAILIIPILNLFSLEDVFLLNTVTQRLADYNLWAIEMNDFFNVIFGRECKDCSSFYSDASFINLTSSYGILIGLVLAVAPWLLMIFNSISLRNYNLNIQKKYVASYSFSYLSIFIHYQVETQPTQFLFYLSAVLPSILLAKSKEVNICRRR